MDDTTKSWLFVIVQALLLGVLIFAKNTHGLPGSTVRLVGAVIKYAGAIILLVSFYDLRKSLTALPLPKKDGVLQLRGLYKFVRHPMYVGVLVLSLGIAVSSGSVIKYGILFVLFALFSLKARYEENLLLAKYPGYKTYMQKTPRFIPRPRT